VGAKLEHDLAAAIRFQRLLERFLELVERIDPLHRGGERDCELMFVTQGVGCVADQIEQSIAARFNVSAVLDVVGRPIPFSRLIVQPCFCS
jgi:hypothetical protein